MGGKRFLLWVWLKLFKYLMFSSNPECWLLCVLSFWISLYVCVCVCAEILKKGSSVHPALLKEEVEAVRDKQRSPVYCDQLLQHISLLPTESTASCTEWRCTLRNWDRCFCLNCEKSVHFLFFEVYLTVFVCFLARVENISKTCSLSHHCSKVLWVLWLNFL